MNLYNLPAISVLGQDLLDMLKPYLVATGSNTTTTTTSTTKGNTTQGTTSTTTTKPTTSTTTTSTTVKPTTSTTTTTTTSKPVTSASLYPLNANYAYELDNIGDGVSKGNGLSQLFDGIDNVSPIMGYGKVLTNDNFWFDLLETTQTGLAVTKVRLFSYQGSASIPWTVSAWNKGVVTTLASFKGGVYNQWVEFDMPLDINGNPTIIAQRLWINAPNGSLIPTEMEIYGTWTPKTVVLGALKQLPFKQMCGVDGFAWDLQDSNTFKNIPIKLTGLQTFNQFRIYTDWNLLEQVQGLNTFNPMHSGGWMYDQLLTDLKINGIDPLFCLHNQPVWMQNTWPVGTIDDENIPVIYSNLSNINSPSAYKEQARTAFQIAARYGATKVATSLLTIDTSSRWNGDTINQPLSGLNILKYLECDNERDKWWKGVNAYQNGYQYAANLSAFYDGHLNTMGVGIGVKNADPNMQVVIGGIASARPDYFRAIIDWSRDNRGYLADGVTVNLPFDVINYHSYAGGQSGGKVDCPEIYGFDFYATPIVNLGLEYGKEVWITETGYDTQVGSPIAASAIGAKTVDLVKADWMLRSALLFARTGVNRVYFYETYDNAPGNSTQFETSGLLNTSLPNGRTPSADYLYQTKQLIGNYNFISSQTVSGIIIDTYSNGTQNAYVLFSPTQTGVVVNYNFSTTKTSTKYTLTPGATAATATTLVPINGVIPLVITETPIILI